MLDHPLVQNFWEEQGGVQQRIILCVLSRHIKILERQIEESVLIERTSEVEGECLNIKLEWAGSKIPGLRVNNPKGVDSNKEGGDNEEEDAEIGKARTVYREALRRGSMRLNIVFKHTRVWCIIECAPHSR